MRFGKNTTSGEEQRQGMVTMIKHKAKPQTDRLHKNNSAPGMEVAAFPNQPTHAAKKVCSFSLHGYGRYAIASGALLSTLPVVEGAIQYSGLNIMVRTSSTIHTLAGPGGKNIYLSWDQTAGGLIRFMATGSASFLRTGGALLKELDKGDNITGTWVAAAAAVQGREGVSWSGYFTSATVDDSKGYIGFRLDQGDGYYNYGWIHVSGFSDSINTKGELSIDGWAYQDDVNTAILAGQRSGGGGGGAVPEPSGLALLACGAAGIYALRRKRKESA